MSESQQPEGAGSGPARSWRPQQTRKAARSARRLKIIVGFTFLIGLVGTLAWLFFRQSDVQTITFIGIGRTDYQRVDLPLNAGARQDVQALTEVFQAIRDEYPEQVAELADTSEALHDRLADYLTRAVADAETLVVFCSLHGQVTSGADQPTLSLLVGSDSAGGSQGGTANSSVSLRSLLDMMTDSPAEDIVLLLDAAAGPTWSQGLFAADVMDQINEETKDLDKRVTVICATTGHETSWAVAPVQPDPDSEEPAWKHQPGTVFGNAVHSAFCDKASDANGNTVLEVGELYDYVRKKCQSWNQQVHWIGSEKNRETRLTETFPSPPATADSEQKNDAKKPKPKDGEEPLSPEDRLAKLWEARDELWLKNPKAADLPDRRGVLSSTRPLTWRQFNQELVWIEEAVRYQLHMLPEYTSAIEDRFVGAEKKYAALSAAANADALAMPSVYWSEPAPLTEQQNAAAAGVWDRLLAEAKAAGGEPPPAEGPPPLESVADRMLFARWLSEQIISTDPEELSAKLTQTQGALKAMGAAPGIHWRASTWPFELLSLQDLCDVFAGQPLSRDDALTVRRAIVQRAESSRLGGLLRDESLRPEIQSLARAGLEGNLKCIVAAERWLLAGQMDRANHWLDRARKNHLEQAQQLNEDMLQLIAIRETLLAELPDHALWAACRLEHQGLEFTESIRTADSPAGSAVLDLFEDLERAASLLDGSSTPAPRDVTELVRRVRQNRGRLDQAIREHCLGLTAPQAWPEIDYALRNPWIRAGTRKQLVAAFHARTSGAAAAKSSGGLWHDFWSAKSLGLAFPADELTMTPTADFAARLRNRATLSRKWSELGGLLGKPEDPKFERAVRLATVSIPPAEIEEELAEQRRRLRRELHTLVAGSWARRGQRYNDVLVRVPASVLDRDAAGRGSDPVMSDLPEFKRCDSDGSAKIEVRWSGGSAGDTMNLIAIGDGIAWNDQAEAVRRVQFGESVALRLASRTPRPVMLALTRPPADSTDRDDDPMDIRTLMLAPEFNARGWAVNFVLPEPPEQQQTLFQRSDAGKVDATELWLNANTSVGTQLRLNRPAGSPAGQFDVELLSVDRAGGLRRTGLAGVAVFAKDQAAVPLKLAPAEGADPPASIDASAGMVFRVRAEDGQQFELRVTPWIRAAEDFLVEAPRCEISGRKLTVTVRRKVRSGILPDVIEFLLEPGQNLRQLCEPRAPQLRKLDSEVVEQRVSFTLDPEVLRFEDDYELSLSVAGVPHAYRWRLTQGGRQDLLTGFGRPGAAQKPSVRIATPDGGTFVASPDAVSDVRIEVDTPHAAFNQLPPATLRLSIKFGGETLDFHKWENVRGPSRNTTLSLKDGLVVLDASMRDYVVPAKDLLKHMTRKNGQYELVAELSRDGDTVDQMSVRFGLDTTAPGVTLPEFPRAADGKWPLVRREDGKRVLKLNASVVEDESPVVKHRLRILRDDTDAIDPVRLSPGKADFGIEIPGGKLPTEPGTYEFVLEAENAAKLTGKNESRHRITIRPVPKPEAGKSGN